MSHYAVITQVPVVMTKKSSQSHISIKKWKNCGKLLRTLMHFIRDIFWEFIIIWRKNRLDIIPELGEIGKPELSQLFSELINFRTWRNRETRTFTTFLRTHKFQNLEKKGNQNFSQNSFNFKSSGIISMKSRTLGKFGFSTSKPNKTRSSAFDLNSRTFKIEGILSSEKSC